MITLIRWYILQSKKIKLKLILYNLLEEELTTFIKNPKIFEENIIYKLAEIIHTSNIKKENLDDN